MSLKINHSTSSHHNSKKTSSRYFFPKQVLLKALKLKVLFYFPTHFTPPPTPPMLILACQFFKLFPEKEKSNHQFFHSRKCHKLQISMLTTFSSTSLYPHHKLQTTRPGYLWSGLKAVKLEILLTSFIDFLYENLGELKLESLGLKGLHKILSRWQKLCVVYFHCN